MLPDRVSNPGPLTYESKISTEINLYGIVAWLNTDQRNDRVILQLVLYFHASTFYNSRAPGKWWGVLKIIQR